jgi:HK97 family phage major capsid protein
MKKLIELKQERSAIVDKMSEVVAALQLIIDEAVAAEAEDTPLEEVPVPEISVDSPAPEATPEENSLRKQWKGYDAKIKAIDDQIALLERQEELNKRNVKPEMKNTIELDQKSLGVRFRDFLIDAVENGKTATFRVEPMMSTSNTDILNKTVQPLDLMTSPGEEFLRSLGVTIYTGLNGQIVLPNMEQETAGFVAEGVCNGDASMNIADVILAPRRVTNSQSVTREFLAQTNPDIYASLLQNLTVGIWNAVVTDFFTQVIADAGAGQQTVTGTTATYADILNLEASLGCYSLDPKYVTTPAGRATFKTLATVTSVAGPAWYDNQLNGYPAFATCALPADHTILADWGKTVLGQWGGIEVIVDPFTYATCGKIKVTTLGLFDSGVYNPRGIVVLDASL